jgi:hypothetical protein
MSRMCREKGAVKHDDRLDCLAQGVQYYTDALAISATEQIKLRELEEFNDMLQDFLENPESSANHIVLGMNLDQRRKARGKETGNSVPTWV